MNDRRMSKFEYDDAKSKFNELRHGISFEATKKLWEDSNLVIGPAASLVEERWVAVGTIENKHWVAVFTYRGDAIRLVTCRRARKEEVLVYEQSK